jgi:hypothetical protein
MILDKIEGFNALTRSGMHVVRARYVDSAEDAIAFAARRDATDERAVPILLRAIVANDGGRREDSLVEGPLTGHEAIRRAHRELTARVESAGGKIVAEASTEQGSDIAIEGRTDASLGKVVVLRSRTHSVERMMPLEADGAQTLVAGFQAHHHQPPSEKTRRMLEHLVMRAAAFFEESGAESFALDPVRLHENSYTILDATLRSLGPLHVDKRLAPHAHDRKGYDYHPSGRQ